MAAAMSLACGDLLKPPTAAPATTPSIDPTRTPSPEIRSTSPSPTVSSTPFVGPTAIAAPPLEPATTPMPALVPTATSVPPPTVSSTPPLGPAATPSPPTQTEVEVPVEVEASIGGYWSDGSANVKLEVSLPDWGSYEPDQPVQVAVSCRHDGQILPKCGGDISLPVSSGSGTEGRELIQRVPMGQASFVFDTGEQGTHTLDFNVPERILGVDRDVWACFSDTSKANSIWQEDEGIGCAAWAEGKVLKWDQSSPILVSVNGPSGFTSRFIEVLHELSPVVNLQFEMVTHETRADIVAHIGLTDPVLAAQEVYCPSGHVGGCANTTTNLGTGGILDSEIIVYNRWPDLGTDIDDFSDQHRGSMTATMLHEAVHALTRMQHRTELLSIMNDAIHHRNELSPMDEALLRLHGHTLIRRGMTLAEIEDLIVFNDELLDPKPPDQELSAWKLASNAYEELRKATSASFMVRSSLPGCAEQSGWARYQVGNLTQYHPYFGWASINTGEAQAYLLQPDAHQYEYWLQSGSQWTAVNRERLSSALFNWRWDLSDPHHILESILYYADWTETQLSFDLDGRATLRVKLDQVRGPTTVPPRAVEIVLVVDAETNRLLEYSMTWELDDVGCGTYLVEGTEGIHGTAFTFPEAIRAGSAFLDSCENVLMGSLTGYIRQSGDWARECGLDRANQGYVMSYRFSLDDWAFVRFELSSPDDILLVLSEEGDSGLEVVDMEAAGDLLGASGVPYGNNLLWAHVPLPAGQYEAEVVTRTRALPGTFTFIATAQPTPPPPYRFKSISVSGQKSCGLLTDGTPLCWGRRNVEGDGTVIPKGTFESISAGAHKCALYEDGTPLCWDFKEEGEHTCSERNGATWCKRVEQPDPPDSSGDRDGGRTAVRTVRVIAGYFDQTPPAGEKLVSISTGWVHSCGLREDGTALCWGSNQHGKSSPPEDENFLSVDAGVGHSCGIREDGTTLCWGADVYGQSSAPEDVQFIEIVAGEEHTCGLQEDGTSVCWGDGGLSVCAPMPGASYHCKSVGILDHVPPSPPEQARLASLSSGYPVCGLEADGQPVCWTSRLSGLVPAPAGERFTSISSSDEHACALRFDSTAVCWGLGLYGQSSPPSGLNLTDTQSPLEPPTGLVSISSGAYHTCAVDSEGAVICWGPNWWKGRFDGQFKSISSGEAHSCALRADGSVICKGSNGNGQLSAPAEEVFVSLSSGAAHSCGLRSDGTALCWGWNERGQASPPANEAFISISSGVAHTCGITEDGGISCWGRDGTGPSTPPSNGIFSSIDAGGFHTCALHIDGSPICWGLDREGQLSAPTDQPLKSLSSGHYHTCGLGEDGTAICWGAGMGGETYYEHGQATPPADERFVSLSSGAFHTCGLRADGTAVCWGSNDFRQAEPAR